MYQFCLKTRKWTLLYFDNMHEQGAPFSTFSILDGVMYRLGGRPIREKVKQSSTITNHM
jgi:hypothetical protein